MTDPVERLVNLALLIAGARTPVSAEQVRAKVAGYPQDQDQDAFLRMFERDKDDLRAAGLDIVVERGGDVDRYRLDAAGTFAGDLALSPEEAVLLHAAGAAMLADPSFPFGPDLRLALAKVSAAAGGGDEAGMPCADTVSALVADEEPAAQAACVADLARALAARKLATFTYSNLGGRTGRRVVEPYGLFARDGRWYLVGRDRDADGIRVFAVTRLSELKVETGRPKSADFERPSDFRVRDWMPLPFQYGPDRRNAVLRLTGPAAARSTTLAGGQGVLETQPDGAVVWRVTASDLKALAGWAVDNGPGIELLEPPEALEVLAEGLRRVVADHER